MIKGTNMASFSNSKIPEDLLIDILARLPVKSLLRFKCVNKYWNTLIESPNFISTHHNRNPTMLLVLRYVSHRDVLRDPDPNRPSDRFICEFFGYDIVSDDESYVVTISNRFAPIADISSSDDECNTSTTSSEGGINFNAVGTGYPNSSMDYWSPKRERVYEDIHKEFALAMFRDDDINKLSEQPQSEPPPYEDLIDITDIGGLVNHLQTITGPVDGLFLLHNGCGTLRAFYNRLALWNPATTELRLLPSPDFNVFFPNPDCIYVFGFGLDPLTNNYKVVWIPVQGSTNPDAEPPNVALYSLETNSWRHFNAVLPSVAKMFHSESTYLNGSYYWLSQHVMWEQMKQRIKVVLFDMGNDVFREIEISDDFTRNLELGVEEVRIMVHNGDSIALLVTEYIRGTPDFVLDSIDMWVMKQEHEGCWTKLFTLGLRPHLQLEKPLGFWKNNNQMFFTTSSNSEFVLYNVDTGQISHIGVQCDLHPAVYYYSPSIFNYKESLVSFGGQKKCCKRGKLHAMVQDLFAFQPTPP